MKMPSVMNNSASITIDLSHHPPNSPLGVVLAPGSNNQSSQRHDDNHHHAQHPTASTTVILAGWNRVKNNNKLGPIQKLGRVRIGDRLVAINGVDVRHMTFRQVLDTLRNMVNGTTTSSTGNTTGRNKNSNNRTLLKSLSFTPLSLLNSNNSQVEENYNSHGDKRNPSIWSSAQSISSCSSSYNRNGTQIVQDNGMGGEDNIIWNICAKSRLLYKFSSTIKRVRIHHSIESSPQEIQEGADEQQNERGNKNISSFVQYEITCRLMVQFNYRNYQRQHNRRQNQQQQTYNWSVWKRYSEFQELDTKLRQTFGWQMIESNKGWDKNRICFPSSHHITSFIANTWAKSRFSSSSGTSTAASSAPIDDTSSSGNRKSNTSKIQQRFIKQRRGEIKQYWEGLQDTCEEMFDFSDPSSHRYSRHVSDFLEIEEYFPRRGSNGLGRGGGPAASSSSVISGDSGDEFSVPSFGMNSNNQYNNNIDNSIDLDTSALSHISPSPSAPRTLVLGGNSSPGNEIRSGENERKQQMKRNLSAAKPAFKRRLLDSL